MDIRAKHQDLTISSIDKLEPPYYSTHRRAIEEESKVANRDLVDHQARSLLQYIYVIANFCTMRKII